MLKRHRKSLGWTQQQLADALCQEAGRATLTRQEIYRWEKGRRVPTFWLSHLASVLGITRDELERVTSAMMNEDDRDRIAHSLAAPSHVDAGTVAALADVLAAQRRLDDSLPATTMLPATAAQWESVEQLAREARGPHADALRYVAAEYVQFLGWLHAEARNDRYAVRYLTEAEERADDLDDGPLVAQAANFKGYLARQQGRPRAVVRWFSAAYHTPGAAPLQRVGDAVQAAHGYALLGERETARRLLGEASDLADEAAGTEAPDTAYWLSPTFSRMGMGLVHLALGDNAEAAANLRAGLDGLPTEQRDAEWTREYRVALEQAQAA